MKTSKIIDSLRDALNQEGGQKKKKKAALENVLAKLEKNEARLFKKIAAAHSGKEKKKLKKTLKVNQAQHEKGIKAIAKL